MMIRTVAGIGLVGLSTIIVGCRGEGNVPSPVSPSPALPQVANPPSSQPGPGPGAWLGGTYTLTAVSLYGLVYEETPSGRVGIARAAVYCEVCGSATHTWAIADGNGFYRFSPDLAAGGGVWLRPDVSTEVGWDVAGYRDPPGVLLGRFGPGWRQVMISGDTQFDIQLIRR